MFRTLLLAAVVPLVAAGSPSLEELVRLRRAAVERPGAESKTAFEEARLEHLCAHRNPGACGELGRRLALRGEKDRAALLLRDACGAGVIESCRALGLPADVGSLESACATGKASACHVLADTLMRGENPDCPRVRELVAKSCDAGVPLACARQSKMIAICDGSVRVVGNCGPSEPTEAELASAARALRRACDGVAESCAELALAAAACEIALPISIAERRRLLGLACAGGRCGLLRDPLREWLWRDLSAPAPAPTFTTEELALLDFDAPAWPARLRGALPNLGRKPWKSLTKSALLFAVLDSHRPELARGPLLSGARPDLVHEGRPLLAALVEAGLTDEVRALLRRSRRLAAGVLEGALESALGVEDLAATRALVSAGARVRMPAFGDDLPLLSAELLDAALPAKPDAALLTRLLELSIALKTGAPELLLVRGAQPTRSSRPLLAQAILAGRPTLALALIARGGDGTIAKEGWPLHAAVARGQLDVVRELLRKKADPSRPDLAISTQPPLATAIVNRFEEIALVLLGAGAPTSAPNGTPLLVEAARAGQRAVVAKMLELKADPNATLAGVPAVHVAIAHGHPEIVRLLLAAGADPNGTAAEARVTPLMLAAERDDVALVELLLAHGADPSTRTIEGVSAIDLARGAGGEKIQTLLGGADPASDAGDP